MNNMTEFCSWCGYNAATDGHHLFTRAGSPELIEAKENIVDLCRRCHELVTNSREFAQLMQIYFFAKPERKLSEKKITEHMDSGEQISPRDLARYRNFLAAQFSFYTEELLELEKRYPIVWNEIRKDVKSDTAAERLYDATEQGLKRSELRARLKKLEKLMSALKTTLEVMNHEARNQY